MTFMTLNLQTVSEHKDIDFLTVSLDNRKFLTLVLQTVSNTMTFMTFILQTVSEHNDHISGHYPGEHLPWGLHIRHRHSSGGAPTPSPSIYFAKNVTNL